MTNLVVASEGSSFAARKIATLLNHNTDSKILLFYIVPWHAIIQRSKAEAFDQTDYIDFLNTRDQKDIQDLLEDIDLSKNDIDFRIIPTKDLSIPINSEQWLTIDINNRFNFSGITRKESIKYVNLLKTYYFHILKRYKPKYIFDLDTSGIHREVLYLVAKKLNVEYVSLTHSRYKQYVLITTSLGKTINNEKKYKKIKLPSENIGKTVKEIEEYSNGYDPLINAEEASRDKLNKNYGLYALLKELVSGVLFIYNVKMNYRHSVFKYSKISKKFILIISPNVYKGVMYNYLTAIKKLFRSYFTKSITSTPEKYYYFPLSYTLEGQNPGYSNGWLNDLFLINYIRSFIPIDSHLLIKDHRAMFGERTFKDIRKIRKLDQVFYIPVNSKNTEAGNPRSLISKAEGIITIAGTSGLEAAILGKPLLVFGNPVYKQFIDHSSNCGFNDLISFFNNPSDFIPNKKDVVRFINIVQKKGISINYSGVLTWSPKVGDTYNEDFEKILNIFKEYT